MDGDSVNSSLVILLDEGAHIPRVQLLYGADLEAAVDQGNGVVCIKGIVYI